VLRDVVAYTRVFDGFAATVRTQDVGRLNSRGARVQPVRRTYPATGEPVPVKAGKPKGKAASAGQPPVAVLDTGVDVAAVKANATLATTPSTATTTRAGRDPAGRGTEMSGRRWRPARLAASCRSASPACAHAERRRRPTSCRRAERRWTQRRPRQFDQSRSRWSATVPASDCPRPRW
jgi:hypothetical protein